MTTTLQDRAVRELSESARPRPVRASVLLVDDQPARLLTYEAILSDLEVDCVRALSGREALERLLKQEFAVIVLDVNMPEMDGFELARRIREHPRLERTPIVFCTGMHMNPIDQLRGYEVGAIDYLSVPVVPEILRSKVAVLVELHQRRAELRELNRELEDTRARIRAESDQAHADRELLHRAIQRHPSDLLVVMQAVRDDDGKIRDWIYRDANLNCLAYLEMARLEDLVGRSIHEVLGEGAEDASRLCDLVIVSGETLSYETRARNLDLLVRLYPIGPDCVVSSAVDITQRKAAESALRDGEMRVRALLENAPVGVAHNEMDGRFTYVNEAFCKIVGYTVEELLDKTWQEITHPDDLNADLELGQSVLRGELPHYMLEKRYVRKDGSVVWASLFGNFVFDQARRPMLGVAVAIDVTHRRLAERALRLSEQRFLLAKTAARLGTFDWNIVNDSMDWDARTREIWGLAPDESVNYAKFIAGIHSDDRPGTQRAVDRSLDPRGDGRYIATYRVVHRADGVVRWVEAIGQVTFENGRPVRMLGTVQDLTDRKHVEETLWESEQRFRELANNIDQMAWTCDAQGKRTWFNQRWYDYTGTRFEDVAGEGWHRVHDPKHLPRVLKHLQSCLRAGQHWEDTFPLRGKHGEYRWFLTRAVPIYDADGHVVRWLGTNTDVTELRRLQEALKETDRRKDEFLAMLAHELRNPVAPIRTAAEVLSRQPTNEVATRSLVGVIERQAGHLARLLDDLLDAARITQGLVELRPETLSVAHCIELAIETAQPLIREKGHRLTLTPALQPLNVRADRVRLVQCLANLLTNAAKFTAAQGEIRVTARRDETEAVVTVEDTGVGIAAEFLPRVFDLFAQSKRSLDRTGGGLGIGLSVCKQLIERQGGRISAHSEGEGRGAQFEIRLPLESSVATVPDAIAEQAEGQRRRILVVDDNQDAANTLGMLLELNGHVVKTVYSGEGALGEFGSFAPEIVFLDIGLPGMNGYEVGRRIRKLDTQVRLIALSGYGQRDDRLQSAEAGFEAHLVKPVELGAVERLLMN